MEIDVSGHMYIFNFLFIHCFFVFFVFFCFFCCFLAMVPDGVLVQIIGFSKQDETTSYVTNRSRKGKGTIVYDF